MPENKSAAETEKPGLHSRNPHRSRYDFGQLVRVCPELAPFVKRNKYENETIDFAEPEAVKLLNKALLRLHYKIDYWDIPSGYLCPPVPGRADYIHHVADLLAEDLGGTIPTGKSVSVLDIGVGANCIFPIVGCSEYGWRFVGSDIDPNAIQSAKKIVTTNTFLKNSVKLRLQPNPSNIFSNILKAGEIFSLSVCNPPFHSSSEKAMAGSNRKQRNLFGKTIKDPIRNFGGHSNELWYNGGEAEFIRRMIKQSSELHDRAVWFTSLVSQKANLPGVDKVLRKAEAKEVRTIEMVHGHKLSRIVAWTFFPVQERKMQLGKLIANHQK